MIRQSHVAFLTFLFAVSACKSGNEQPTAPATPKTEPAAKKPAPAPEPEETNKLPAETEDLALDQGKSKIPATITVPKGSTTFNDTPTTIRISYPKRGDLFGVQVKKGNEFNMNLAKFAKDLLKNEYGNTNKILEQSKELLRYTMTRKGGKTNHKFSLLVKLGDTTWVCKQGNYGGWTAEQTERQLAACKTLKAK